ncbi:MAG TPA: hypothetical protein VIO60_02865 [Rectinemataceae bacterium]
MGITLIIVGGIVIISVVATIGDFLTKSKVAKSSIDPGMIQRLDDRIAELERKTQDQDRKIESLEADLAFANKLLEDKTT